MTRLCTICARGGSKGVEGKNLMDLGGKPLLAHSIEQALASGLFGVVAVSSDSEAILQVASEWGAEVIIKRPGHLATDRAPKVPVIQHAVQTAEAETGMHYDTLVDLDATSPLRVPADIVGAVGLLETRGVSQVITAMPARRSPYFNLVELDAAGHVQLSKRLDSSVSRRQDAPACFDMNASVYVWTREGLTNWQSPFNPDTLLYEMPEERSVDVDSPLDAEWVRFLYESRDTRSYD
ncbi:cytidylyltransferase domain-containing protein [Rubricoccus marinus]|uniref:Flagellar modification protein B n=1 Tax=Rubricoccus marinus TaxID=716817 RepID=A0A259U0F4_9BACT|nr:acylneuraminate cytidylyltransferase family protein [Rubricoccus marinus]OZC03430.1 flagellar modification protein B [Rubricoccus marinus]